MIAEPDKIVDAVLDVTSSKPDISSNDDALDDKGDPLFGVNDSILIERYVDFGKRIWLDTREYRVVLIDFVTGDVQLFDEENKQSALTNFRRAPKQGDIFKISRRRRESRRH